MTYQFQTSDLVCSRMIEIELDERGERVKRVQFVRRLPPATWPESAGSPPG